MIEEALASIVYPGLAAICVLWTSIGMARWMEARRLLDLILTSLATVCGATFVLLSISTGVFVLIPFEAMRLSIRIGWMITLVLAILVTAEFLRRQHATYRSRR